MPPLREHISIFLQLQAHDAISAQRPEMLRQASPSSWKLPATFPALQDSKRWQSRAPREKHGSQPRSHGQAGQLLPAQCPQGVIRHCPLGPTASVLQQEHQHPRSQREVGMRTQGSCCPAPGTEDPGGARVSPPDRGCLCCTGLRLFSAMTLARS